MTTATLKTLAEMTIEELKTLKDAADKASREQVHHLGTVPFKAKARRRLGTVPFKKDQRELREAYYETMRFMGRVDDELRNRGA